MKVWTVAIRETADEIMEPWVASFTTSEKAHEFMRKADRKLHAYGVADSVSITLDSGSIDDEYYLDWIDGRWCPYMTD